MLPPSGSVETDLALTFSLQVEQMLPTSLTYGGFKGPVLYQLSDLFFILDFCSALSQLFIYVYKKKSLGLQKTVQLAFCLQPPCCLTF